MSKGSGRRPRQVSTDIFEQNWDRIFSGKTRAPTQQELAEKRREVREKHGTKTKQDH